MLGYIEIATGDGEAPLGEHRTRGPDLLAVEYPFFAVEHGLGGQRSQIGPGGGLGEQLATIDVLAHQRFEELLLLLGGAERGDGAGDQAHRRRGQLAGRRDDELGLFAVVRPQVRVRQTAPTEFDRVVEHRVAGVELQPLPTLAGLETSTLLVLTEVVEHGHVVAALAPDEGASLVVVIGMVGLGQRFGVLFEPDAGFLAEQIEIREFGGHSGNATSVRCR